MERLCFQIILEREPSDTPFQNIRYTETTQQHIPQRNRQLYTGLRIQHTGSYFMVHFIYRFSIFKGGASMNDVSGPGGRGRDMAVRWARLRVEGSDDLSVTFGSSQR